VALCSWEGWGCFWDTRLAGHYDLYSSGIFLAVVGLPGHLY